MPRAFSESFSNSRCPGALARIIMTRETGDVLVKRLAAIGAGLVRDHVAKGLHD